MSRTRFKGHLAAPSCDLLSQWDNCSQSSETVVGSQDLFAKGKLVTMTDTVVPGFHKSSSRGKVFMNPLQVTSMEIDHSGGGGWRRKRVPISCGGGVTHLTRYGSDGPQWQSLYSVAKGQALTAGRLPPLGDLISPQEIQRLLTECATKVHDQRGRGDANVWEAIAEFGKSVDMLRGITMGIVGVFRKGFWDDVLKYGGRRPALAKKAADSYLTMRYGLIPLIKDTQSIYEGMLKAVGHTRETTRGNGTLFRSSVNDVTYSGATVVSFREDFTDQVNIRCMSLDEFDKTFLHNVGLGPKGLITLPWELLPRSFVYDWFGNFGQFIGALVPAFGWTQLGSCYTIERIRTTDVSVLTNSETADYTIEAPYFGSLKYVHVSKIRTPGLPPAGLVVRQDFGFDKLLRKLDALSLAYQLLHGYIGRRR